MGVPKALLDTGGMTFASRLVETLSRAGCHPVVVVGSSPSGELADEVERGPGELVVNPGGHGGQIGSLCVALDHLGGLADPPAAIAFTPVDNPGVARETVRALVEAWRRSRTAIVLPRYGDRRGHPVVADMSIASEFQAEGLPEGARTVVRRDPGRVLEVEVADPGVTDDLDTPGRYRARFPETSGDNRMNPSPAQVAARVLEALEKGKRIYTAVVTASADVSLIGRRWWLSGRRHGGTLGSPSLDREVAAALPALFPPRESRGALSRRFDYRDGDRSGSATVYIELHGPPARMVIVGAGHIAIPLSHLGNMLGLRVEVLDDRPGFANRERFPGAAAVRVIDFRNPFAETPLAAHDHVVLVTRGHSFDYECLVRLLRMNSMPHYIGMIGSRRRVRATHEQLLRDGFTTEEMGRVRAPVGLDLGGQTPVEIAVSVAAEIIMFHAGGTGAPLVEKERVVERFFRGRRPAGKPASRSPAE